MHARGLDGSLREYFVHSNINQGGNTEASLRLELKSSVARVKDKSWEPSSIYAADFTRTPRMDQGAVLPGYSFLYDPSDLSWNSEDSCSDFQYLDSKFCRYGGTLNIEVEPALPLVDGFFGKSWGDQERDLISP